jgi:tRNA threonylcarbamoyladenosine biosynthesis protein TsaB
VRILAIDTALGACSACVVERGVTTPLASETMLMERGHAEECVPLLDRILSRVDGGGSSLDRIAVTIGPGSFTGLRVGLAAARAAGLALEKPVVGVSTLAAFLAPMLASTPDRVIAAAIDARHGRIYVQAQAPGGRVLIAPKLLVLRDAVRALGSSAIGLAGPAAPILANEAWAIGLDAMVIDAAPAPDITWVARLGMAADPQSAPPVPLYLREADATPQDRASLPRR